MTLLTFAFAAGLNGQTPSIAIISPNAALTGASVQLFVYGSGFSASGATILWNSSPLSTFYLDYGIGLSANIPAAMLATAGSATITVRNPGGATSNGLPFSVVTSPPVPTIASARIYSDNVPFSGKHLSLDGSGFLLGMSISCSGISLGTYDPLYGIRVPGSLAPGPGTINCTATNPGGQPASFSLTLPAARTLTSISPNSVVAGSTFTLVAIGSGFTSDDLLAIDYYGTLPTTFISSTELHAAVPSEALNPAPPYNETVEVYVTSSTSTGTITSNTVPLGVGQGALRLSISMTHAGNFALGQQNATYHIGVSNAALVPVNNNVNVDVPAPSGLTLASISGMGWTCSVASARCSRSDNSPVGQVTYPPITLTVNVSASAPAIVTYIAQVSAGIGSAAASAYDPAIISSADNLGPDLHISGPNGTVTTSSVTLTGVASDSLAGKNGISSITVNGTAASGGVVGGTQTAFWSLPVTLNLGANTFTVVAKDGSPNQNATTSQITITYALVDTQPPSLTINSPADGSTVATSTVTVSGTASDLIVGNNGISSVTVNGIAASGGTSSGPATANWSALVPLSQGANTIVVVAKDASSNQNATSKQITVTSTAPDSQGPSLTIASPAAGSTIATSTIAVSGTASDSGFGNNGISAVTVNGVAAVGGTASGWNTANWSAQIPLNPGANTITVVAKDASSSLNGSTQQITVTYTPGASGLKFVTVTPCRVVDTRNTNGPFGGPAIPGGGSRNFNIPNSACGIPSTAAAYSINVTVVPHGQLGYLTVFPGGQAAPLVSTLNSLDGRVKANAAVVPAGASGAIAVFATDTTDVVLDINGYFVPASGGSTLTFFPLAPCRIADTRNANGSLGGPFLAGGHSRSFPILAGTCNVPGTALAYSLNFTAVPRGSLGYLTVYPTGSAAPLVSTLNAIGGQITANAALVPAGTNGAIDAFAANDTDLVIDIDGYFAPSSGGGLSLYNVTPCRVVDTRNPAGSPPFSGTRSVNVAGSPCAVPGTAQAYVFNATVVPPGPLGYLTLWPQGQSQPFVSTLNSLDGSVTSNLAIVPTTNGSVNGFMSNSSHLILDVSGYFAP